MIDLSILATNTRQEITDEFNSLELSKKIIVSEFFIVIDVLVDKLGTYFLKGLGNEIYCKHYFDHNFNKDFGYSKDVIFFYKKDDEEKDQDEYIYNLIK